jgi:hypothetical protein
MRKDKRFKKKTSICTHACFALKDRTPNSQGQYNWLDQKNLMIVCCSVAQALHDGGEGCCDKEKELCACKKVHDKIDRKR